MEKIVLSNRQIELLEKMGVIFESNGMPPAQSRILGLLMIADRTELTFDEIRELLMLSKSATSNGIQSLLMMNHIKYITKLGDRKRYFTSKISSMESDFENKFAQMLEMKNIFREILEVRTKETPEFNEKLARVIDFLEYLQKELPVLYKNWSKKFKT